MGQPKGIPPSCPVSPQVLETKTNEQNTLLLAGPSGFPADSGVKNPPANAGDLGLIPGLGRSPGEGHGNPLQYSCLENSMDIGAWQATVQGITKESDTIKATQQQLVHCVPSHAGTLEVGQADGQHRKRGWERTGTPACVSVFCLQLPVVKTQHFQVPGSQRGTGDANFISLDPSSLRLQQAGGRKLS